MTMKKSIFLCAVALLAGAGMNTVNAQNAKSGADREARRAEMLEKRVERMAKVLELKDAEKEAFATTYRAYLAEMASGAPTEEPKEEKAAAADSKKKKTMTDAEATQKIQDNFQRQAQRIERLQKQLEVQKKYYAEFSKTLTPTQLVKIFTMQRADGERSNNAGARNNGARRAPNGGPRGGGFGGGFDGPGGGFGGMD